MFWHRMKCSLKLVGTIVISWLPLCILAAAITQTARYYIRGDASVFNPLFKIETYFRVSVVISVGIIVLSLLIALSGTDVPDTNIKGYRRFIRDAFRS